GENIHAAEMQLVAADARKGALWRADLGRVVRKSAYIVAEERVGVGELASGQLDAVAAVAGEEDHHFFARLHRLGPGRGYRVHYAGAKVREANAPCLMRISPQGANLLCFGITEANPHGLTLPLPSSQHAQAPEIPRPRLADGLRPPPANHCAHGCPGR